MSAGDASRANAIVDSPCTSRRDTSSLTPERIPGSDSSCVVSRPWRNVTATSPCFAIVTRARSAPFCSSVFDGSLISSQTSRAKWRAKVSEGFMEAAGGTQRIVRP